MFSLTTANTKIQAATAQERKVRGLRQKKATKLLGKKWHEASMRDHARFLAKYQWDRKLLKWKPRDKPKKVTDVMKTLQKRSKSMKTRGKKLGKLGGKKAAKLRKGKTIKMKY